MPIISHGKYSDNRKVQHQCEWYVGLHRRWIQQLYHYFCHLWGEGAIRKICVKGIIFIVRRCGYLVGRGCSDGDRGGGGTCVPLMRGMDCWT